ncbi:MAG: FMN-binding protein [Clostridia bacterium]|nr:FMN-binding protein [Clostridia bacterium]
MKNHIKNVLSLALICAVVALLLAITNSIAAPIIKEQEEAAVSSGLVEVLPNGEGFEALDLSEFTLPETVEEAYSEKNGGYVIKLRTAGYGSDLILMCGIDKDGTVKGVKYVSGNETLGVEVTYGDNLVNTTSDTIDAVETVAGATKTSAAFKNAVKDALNSAVILGGGSVDIRDEATILNDNLSIALPSAEGKFTEIFITEEVGNISAVYKADNNTGFVFVIGENFVAADVNGDITAEFGEAIKNEISAVAPKIINSTMTEIDLSGFADMPSHIQKAYKTSGGNYVFDLRAAGYGINGDKYTRSNEYIEIKVSVTPAGKIIVCKTTAQKESEGIGDACANLEFYSQFNGKEEANYGEIDAIAGATITTNGYKSAISSVFTAIKILEGGAR